MFLIYCLTVNLMFPSFIWRLSLEASKLRSGLLSSVMEIMLLRFSVSMYWWRTDRRKGGYRYQVSYKRISIWNILNSSFKLCNFLHQCLFCRWRRRACCHTGRSTVSERSARTRTQREKHNRCCMKGGIRYRYEEENPVKNQDFYWGPMNSCEFLLTHKKEI